MPLHLGGPNQAESRESARAARKELISKLRNDWDFPVLPQCLHPPPNNLETSQLQAQYVQNLTAELQQEQRPLDFQPISWQERDYSSTDTGSVGWSQAALDTDESRYEFESPDTVGNAVAVSEANKKRKRDMALEEEMSWNAGLAHFVARRNAWTCARESQSGEAVPQPQTDATSSTMPSARGSGQEKLLSPVPPPILPDHPIRSKITPSTYSTIYSKVILQSRLPTVPINLSHITNSLVQGWKEEGNWPLKETVPEASFARKKGQGSIDASIKHPHLKKGVQAVGRVLGIGSTSGAEGGQ